MSDMTASAEAVEEARPAELPADLLDDRLIGQLVDYLDALRYNVDLTSTNTQGTAE
ncbi:MULTISPECIES: hypothetical protein [unclassified Streptomyces]|uniref:hypothetical protein n=1 Tax=unclassified Streptomyces TaxID=2593676 RepID=UPI00379DFDD7